MSRESELLNARKGLIFRITHMRNVPWILDNGVHCRNSGARDPDFVDIGNLDLIDKRNHRQLSVGSGGTLSDYVPFYFTPWSPMLYNIKTGYQGVQKRAMSEIAILVSSIPKLDQLGHKYLISDRHAYLQLAQFAVDSRGLALIDWPLLQSRNFKRDPDHPERFDRYQAEALVHRHLPCAGLIGLVCYAEPQKAELEALLLQRRMKLTLLAQKDMYFLWVPESLTP
jgi:hypothetical protein